MLQSSDSVKAMVSSMVSRAMHSVLTGMGVPMDAMPSREVTMFTIGLCSLSSTLIGLAYYWKRSESLQRELRLAQEELNYLQDKLQQPDRSDHRQGEKREIRIFMDGAFDLLHFGHMNAFRLGRSLGTQLVVGVNSDESITECKGAPLMNDDERLTMVSSCKFVDEVVPDVPYIMSEQYLNWVIEKYNIDYVIHGDDPCIVDGKDVYAAAKEAGKFRTIPRTCGVSTTDIVGRMLLLTKDHHYHNESIGEKPGSEIEGNEDNTATPVATNTFGRTSVRSICLGHQSKFLTTSRMLQLFSAGVKAPTQQMRVVYIDGDWDLFHPGHVATLKAARARGDYLIVGIFSDAVVNRMQGMNLPLMNLHERVLSVLGLVHVRRSQDSADVDAVDDKVRFQHVISAGLLNFIQVDSDFRIENVMQRIQQNQVAFREKFERKMKAEHEYIEAFVVNRHNPMSN